MLKIDRTHTGIIGRWWWTVDRWMLVAVLMLIAFGILLIFAASPAVAIQHHWSSFYFAKRHLIYLVPTIIILLTASLLTPYQVRQLSFVVLGVSLLLLIITPFVGLEVKGARRWISLAGFSLQPSEFVKPAFAVVSAWFFAQKHQDTTMPWTLISCALYVFVIFWLMMQPDLGMAVLITAIWFGEFFIAGLPIFWILSSAFVGVTGLVSAYYLFPHVSSRIDRFLESGSQDRFGDHFQITQSMEAFQAGGFFGRGPGEGIVKKHIPDAHADFIFAVAGEEMGFIFCIIVVAVFAFFVLRGISKILHESNLFMVLAVAGLLIQFAVQTLINLASTLNLMPTKGMTLPFISYGGSSMFALALGVGTVLALTRRRVGYVDL